MAEGKKRILKTAVVILCVVGFVWQTFQFLFMYWTYPTVVDIQISIEPEINMPGITVCIANGFKPENICKMGPYCSPGAISHFLPICKLAPFLCLNGHPMQYFRAVAYNRFFSEYHLNTSMLKEIKVPLDEFLKCKIVSGSGERECDTEHAILGSFYSTDNAPSVCYTINTLWSQPHLEIQKIKKSEKIVMQFFIDTSFRDHNAPLDAKQYPAYNSFSTSAVEMAIHSPYISESPYVAGVGFLGGKNYKVKIKENEKHLLPPPYQTNCTDYMPQWRARGGVGPLNEIMVLQECKLNETLRQLGCVPFTVDYPHDEIVCKFCETCKNITKVGDNCTNLLELNNQPCHSIMYDVQVEEKLVLVEKFLTSDSKRWNECLKMNAESPLKARSGNLKIGTVTLRNPKMQSKTTMYFGRKGFDCSMYNILTRRCQTINVEIVFDEFEIRNITYNPKFESLEVFSAIGGYMGIYLGASTVTFYDFAGISVAAVLKYLKRQRKAKKKHKNRKKNAWMFDDFSEYSSLRRHRKRKKKSSFRIRNNSLNLVTDIDT